MHTKLLVLCAIVFATLFTHSCKKKDPAPGNNNNNGGAPAISKPYYFQAKIDGTWVTYESDDLNWASAMGAESGSNGGLDNMAEYAYIENFASTQSGGIGIAKVNVVDPGDLPTRNALFTLGSKPWGRYKMDSTTDGAIVTYTTNGVEWLGDIGTNQTGSAFSITEFIDNNLDAISYKIVSATFNCKLHDGQGNIKVLTNGRFRGRIIF